MPDKHNPQPQVLIGSEVDEALADREAAVAAISPNWALLTQELTATQVDFLLQRTPKREIKKRPGKGGLEFDYVTHGYVTEMLNRVFGFNWDWHIVERIIEPKEVIVLGRLTVRTQGGQVIVKEQFGEHERYSNMTLGSTLKSAGSDALKKCATLLGIALDLSRKTDDAAIERQVQSPQPARPTKASLRQQIVKAARLRDWSPDQIRERIAHLSGGQTWDDLTVATAADVVAEF